MDVLGPGEQVQQFHTAPEGLLLTGGVFAFECVDLTVNQICVRVFWGGQRTKLRKSRWLILLLGLKVNECRHVSSDGCGLSLM